jgi:hypothetical protein
MLFCENLDIQGPLFLFSKQHHFQHLFEAVFFLAYYVIFKAEMQKFFSFEKDRAYCLLPPPPPPPLPSCFCHACYNTVSGFGA